MTALCRPGWTPVPTRLAPLHHVALLYYTTTGIIKCSCGPVLRRDAAAAAAEDV